MSSSYGRLAAIRDYWMPRDEDARAEVRVTDLNEVLREIVRLRAAIEAAEKAEPVAWLEGPYGEFRANPGYRIAAPQSVAWSIPLYAGTPEDAE